MKISSLSFFLRHGGEVEVRAGHAPARTGSPSAGEPIAGGPVGKVTVVFLAPKTPVGAGHHGRRGGRAAGPRARPNHAPCFDRGRR